MASYNKRHKKSTTKYRKFKVSPLIPIIAIIEVIILLGACTYTWFIYASSKKMDSGVISVDTDSGLDIDFKNITTKEKINIWDYVGQDFRFEPCTSLDGRNLYFPTSGTFNGNQTSDIKFRDATINDINSKYLDIDFELSNTSTEKMSVYLSDESKFHVRDNSTRTDSKALRLAFYLNDGSGGDVSPQLLKNSESGEDEEDPSINHVYFNTGTMSSAQRWTNVYAYLWSSDDGSYLKAFPGSKMTHMYGNYYSFAFSNPDTEDGNGPKYDKILFTDNAIDLYGETGHKTSDLNFHNNDVYSRDKNKSGSEYWSWTHEAYSTKTFYFYCPSDWTNLRCACWNSSAQYTSDGGDPMTYVTGNVYSFTVKDDADTVYFWDADNENAHHSNKPTCTDNKLYYFASGDTSGNLTTEDWGMTNIYFYNSLGWNSPYAHMTSRTGTHQTFKMSSLTGSVYYCTIPKIFTGFGGGNYSKVYFANGDSSTERTVDIGNQNEGVTAGNIYYCSKEKDSTHNNYYKISTDNYDTYTSGGNYAVISPGVSAGFQRSYAPVVKINKESGAAQTIVPAFSYSLDNYVYGSDNPMFSLDPGQRLSLSMIIWLEGTDEDCTENYYANHMIDLYLKFATVLSGEKDRNLYDYCFYDNTKEVWTSDKVTNEAGVSVSPVMQLYDTVVGRGYLMSPKSYTTYNGKKKVDMWQCSAPKELVTETGHELEFRRVNPYDEKEVWNRWCAGTGRQTTNPNTSAAPIVEAYGGNTSGNIIHFTAFADGSPTHASSSSIDESDSERDVKVPTKSCGGLWGNYKTTYVTLNDQSFGGVIKDSDGEGYSGLCTINYKYKYVLSNYSQTIEYKASGTKYRDLYVFVLPLNVVRTNSTNVYDSGKEPQDYLAEESVYFKHYTKFDTKYAINSDKNSNITFDKSWSVSSGTYGMYGNYVQINEKYDDSHTANCYWGKDLMYYYLSNSDVQGQAKKDIMNGAKFKVGFDHINSQDAESGSNRFCYLNNPSNDDGIKQDGYNVYLAVVPQVKPTTGTPNTISSWFWRTKSDDPNTEWNISKYNYNYDQNNNTIYCYQYYSSDTSKLDYDHVNKSELPGRQNTNWPENFY